MAANALQLFPRRSYCRAVYASTLSWLLSPLRGVPSLSLRHKDRRFRCCFNPRGSGGVDKAAGVAKDEGEDDERQSFDINVDVILAGFAFEAYTGPPQNAGFVGDGYEGDVIGEYTPDALVGEFMNGEKELLEKILQTEINIYRSIRDGSTLAQHMEDFYYFTLLETSEGAPRGWLGA